MRIPIKGGMTIPNKTRLLTMAHMLMKPDHVCDGTYCYTLPSQLDSLGGNNKNLELLHPFLNRGEDAGSRFKTMDSEWFNCV